jgi:hypothetical protein
MIFSSAKNGGAKTANLVSAQSDTSTGRGLRGPRHFYAIISGPEISRQAMGSHEQPSPRPFDSGSPVVGVRVRTPGSNPGRSINDIPTTETAGGRTRDMVSRRLGCGKAALDGSRPDERTSLDLCAASRGVIGVNAGIAIPRGYLEAPDPQMAQGCRHLEVSVLGIHGSSGKDGAMRDGRIVAATAESGRVAAKRSDESPCKRRADRGTFEAPGAEPGNQPDHGAFGTALLTPSRAGNARHSQEVPGGASWRAVDAITSTGSSTEHLLGVEAAAWTVTRCEYRTDLCGDHGRSALVAIRGGDLLRASARIAQQAFRCDSGFPPKLKRGSTGRSRAEFTGQPVRLRPALTPNDSPAHMSMKPGTARETRKGKVQPCDQRPTNSASTEKPGALETPFERSAR